MSIKAITDIEVNLLAALDTKPDGLKTVLGLVATALGMLSQAYRGDERAAAEVGRTDDAENYAAEAAMHQYNQAAVAHALQHIVDAEYMKKLVQTVATKTQDELKEAVIGGEVSPNDLLLSGLVPEDVFDELFFGPEEPEPVLESKGLTMTGTD